MAIAKDWKMARWVPSHAQCPGCSTTLALVDRFNDKGEPPSRVLECVTCSVQYRMPMIALEVIPPDEGLVEPATTTIPTKTDIRCMCPKCGARGGAPLDHKRGDKIRCWQCGETVFPKFDPESEHYKLNV